jgi:F0F1-type ATP synthase assembly protein I
LSDSTPRYVPVALMSPPSIFRLVLIQGFAGVVTAGLAGLVWGQFPAVSSAMGALVLVVSTLVASGVWWFLGGRTRSAGLAFVAVIVGEGVRIVLALGGLLALFVAAPPWLSPGSAVLGFSAAVLASWLAFFKRGD